jgi:hypothetical protein
MTISEDDLRGLSAVEREALMNDPDEDGEIALQLGGGDAPAAPNARDLEHPSAGEGEEEEEGAGAAAAAAATAEVEAATAAATTAETAAKPTPEPGEDEDDTPVAPPVRATPADIDDQRKALNAREDESMQKLLDGEISQEDHSKVRVEVRAKLDDLLVAQATDRASDVILHQQMMQSYNVDLKAITKEAKAVGLDYKDEKIGAEFDRAVRMFAGDAAEQGLQDLPGNLAASKYALSEAQALMFRRHGKAAPAAAAPAPAPAAAPAAAKERPAPDRSKLGVTLAAVPTASDAAITTEFAHLDGITEPAALERELAKLTPDQQERYLGA